MRSLRAVRSWSLLLFSAALAAVAFAALSGATASRCNKHNSSGGGSCFARLARRFGAPASSYSNQEARRHRTPRYDAVHAFILTAGWSPPRAANAARICTALVSGGGNASALASRPRVACTVLDALRGEALSDAAVLGFEHSGFISLQPLPAAPWWHALVPKPVLPAFREHPANQMTAVNHRWRKCVANTVGCLHAVRAMADDAAAAADGGRSTLFVFLEDDAELGPAPQDFPAKLVAHAATLPRSWHLLVLAPPPGVCQRAARLLPPWRVPPGGVLTPRYSLSRSTAVALSAQGAARLLAELPATNTIDLWLRSLMRDHRLRALVSCAGLATFHATAASQA